MMRRLSSALTAFVLTVLALAVSAPAQASAPGLQITPLQYEDTLGTTVKNGFIDVANPTDTTITVDARIRGFNQTGTAGDLRFFDDAGLADAIKLDLTSFELGPREAVRVLFSVNPAKLAKGGVYAAIFFQTRPEEGMSESSYVAQSANVGTLLLLKNGSGTPQGHLDQTNIPFLQLGTGLKGLVTVKNTAASPGGIAYRPDLHARVFPWSRAITLPTGLVLPGATRQFAFERPGSYAGLLPLTLSDAATKSSRTVWVLACTGWWAWAVLILILAAFVLLILRLLRGPLHLRRRARAALGYIAQLTKRLLSRQLPASLATDRAGDAAKPGHPKPEPDAAPDPGPGAGAMPGPQPDDDPEPPAPKPESGSKPPEANPQPQAAQKASKPEGHPGTTVH
jgi:hypothetical protein